MNTFQNSYFHIFFACLNAALLISGCASTPTGSRIDNVPMYGQPEIVRPDFLQQADEQFIREAVAGFGTREKASDIWWAQAEEFMAQNNLDFAMRRYNQSWLLNQNNFKAYWGFARVLLEQGAICQHLCIWKRRWFFAPMSFSVRHFSQTPVAHIRTRPIG